MHKIVFSILEIVASFTAIYLMIIKDKSWMRFAFVLLSAVIVFVFAFDSGLLSKLLSLKFVKIISVVQFEFYLLHQALIKTLYAPLAMLTGDRIHTKILLFGIILLLAWIYHWLLQKRLSALLQKLLKKIFTVLKLDIAV